MRHYYEGSPRPDWHRLAQEREEPGRGTAGVHRAAQWEDTNTRHGCLLPLNDQASNYAEKTLQNMLEKQQHNSQQGQQVPPPLG